MNYITQEAAMQLAAELDAQNGRHAPLLHALCNAAIQHYLDSAPLLSHYVQKCIEDDRKSAALAQPAKPDCPNLSNYKLVYQGGHHDVYCNGDSHITTGGGTANIINGGKILYFQNLCTCHLYKETTNVS